MPDSRRYLARYPYPHFAPLRSSAPNRVFRNCHRIVGRGDERDEPVLALGIERELLTVSPTCL
jgi:hypothetical protein